MPEDKNEEPMSPYEEMVGERLALLKQGFEDFPLEEGEDSNSKLPGFIMMHIASIYTRLDIVLAQIDELASPSVEEEEAKADAIADIQKEVKMEELVDL